MNKTKHRKWISIFAVLFCLLWCMPAADAAETAEDPLFSAVLSKAEVRPGEKFTVTLTPNRGDISAFLLSAEYAEGVTLKKTELTGENDGDVFLSHSEIGRLSLVYTAGYGVCLPENAALVLHFEAAAGASAGDIRIEIEEASDASAAPLLSTPEMITVGPVLLPPLSSNSTLLSLSLPEGTLSPAFDPAVYTYKTEVPFSCKTLDFEYVPAAGGTVRVNRRNLGAGGSTVDFKFTVTAEDGKTKSVYTVAVTRQEKPKSPSASESKTDKESGSTASSAGSAAESSPTPSPAPAEIYISAAENRTLDILCYAGVSVVSIGFGMLLLLLIQTVRKYFPNKK